MTEKSSRLIHHRMDMLSPETPPPMELVHRLTSEEQALEALQAGQIDSLIHPHTGAPLLLYQASETLVESQVRHRRLLSRMSALVFELAADGTILYINEAVTRLTGYGYAELIGQCWWDIFCPGDHEHQRDAVSQRFKSGDVSNDELQLTAKDGSTVILELTTANRYGQDQSIERIIGFGVDITRRRTAEATLRASEARYRSIVEMAHEGIWMLDAHGFTTFANKKMAELVGHSQHDIIGTPASAFFGEAAKRLLSPLKTHRSQGADVLELNCRRKDRSQFLALVSSRALFDHTDAYTGALVAVLDITEQNESRENLALMAAIVESSQDAIISEDLFGKIRSWNKGAEALFGYTAPEAIGRSTGMLVPQDKTALEAEVWQKLVDGRPVGYYDSVRLRKDGTLIDVSVTGSPLKDSAGRIIGVSTIARDITEPKRSKAALQFKDEQLRQAQKMEAVGRLASGIAHDFNNLLTVINGYSELALSLDSLDPMLRKDLEQVKSCGFKASLLTRQLLAFSRKQVLEPRILDLNTVVRDVESLLRRVIGEDITLFSRLDPALKYIEADPGQLDQVIMNLAINARDAMPRGGQLVIETKNVQFDEEYIRLHGYVEPGAYIMLAISDTGIGMDQATRSRIFEPFFTTKEPGKGTGLGLSTVYGIVKQSGGSVEVYSEPQRGTTFKIYLPQRGTQTTPSISATSQDSLKGSETILLVEDDDMVRALAWAMLDRFGYHVIEARNGSEALQVCANHQDKIDLLVTDVVMPGMSGRELADQLLEKWPGIRVVYMSGFTDDAVLLHGLLQAEHIFLQKPFSSSGLASKVRQALDFGERGHLSKRP